MVALTIEMVGSTGGDEVGRMGCLILFGRLRRGPLSFAGVGTMGRVGVIES